MIWLHAIRDGFLQPFRMIAEVCVLIVATLKERAK